MMASNSYSAPSFSLTPVGVISAIGFDLHVDQVDVRQVERLVVAGVERVALAAERVVLWD